MTHAAVLIGIASFFLMPSSPSGTKSWFNRKGYFSDKQVKIIVNSGEHILSLISRWGDDRSCPSDP
jgi:hypothetical protein